ncbi:hypothetical protein I6F14_23720 [Bradyrhizobium sp. IC3069]|uniref:hypothetical protein n=1 Tax=unclassified Bradyrhizobium TaxID=2631580 RepID=UPI001CD60E44|nr:MULTISPECIES: hypothetical protein [unclassified Bradyrhizobium]MCA1363414.1 hypothetical protein [Bradyrhizobium sp. IC4059]MCA1520952.1 hypothetical protein [Bradyrhizobium sp. IC3069]
MAKAKKETARRWLYEHFDPSEMDRELSEDIEYGADTEEFDHKQLKRHALNSIDDVVSTVKSLREAYATLASSPHSSVAHEAMVAARVQYGYSKERLDRIDCFGEDVRRQCRRIINEIYGGTEKSSGSVVYLVSTDNLEFVKIGFTSCLERRLRHCGRLRLASPQFTRRSQARDHLNAIFTRASKPLATSRMVSADGRDQDVRCLGRRRLKLSLGIRPPAPLVGDLNELPVTLVRQGASFLIMACRTPWCQDQQTSRL